MYVHVCLICLHSNVCVIYVFIYAASLAVLDRGRVRFVLNFILHSNDTFVTSPLAWKSEVRTWSEIIMRETNYSKLWTSQCDFLPLLSIFMHSNIPCNIFAHMNSIATSPMIKSDQSSCLCLNLCDKRDRNEAAP